MKRLVLSLVCLASAPIALLAQTVVPDGAQIQINSITTATQSLPDIATTSNGDFVVVWDSSNGVAYNGTTLGQIVAADGSPGGSDFQVVGPSAGYFNSNPAIDLGPSDGMVVVWELVGVIGTVGLQGQLLDAGGSTVGDVFQIDGPPASSAFVNAQVDVAVAPAGDFLVVWSDTSSTGSDSSSKSIQGRRFDAAGTAIGDAFQINTTTTGSQDDPKVETRADGGFLVVWDSFTGGILGQRLDAMGGEVGGELQISTTTTAPSVPDLARVGDGSFVAVWRSSNNRILGQRLASDGSHLGSEFEASTSTATSQTTPVVAGGSAGSFLVVWGSTPLAKGATTDTTVLGRFFAADATPVGRDFQVDQFGSAAKTDFAVGGNADGQTLAAWASADSIGDDNDSESIQGQRLRTILFSDGFDDGTIDAWTTSSGF
ncbi:MAG: hypothetical protein AAGE94_04000 [Acidobacteriota bacterium]